MFQAPLEAPGTQQWINNQDLFLLDTYTPSGQADNKKSANEQCYDDSSSDKWSEEKRVVTEERDKRVLIES